MHKRTPDRADGMEATENSSCGSAAPVDWDAWLDAHGAGLLLFAREQTRSSADAEDVLQEALVQLVQAVESGDFRGSAEQWHSYALSAIRHRAVDMGRRAEVRRRYAEAPQNPEAAVCEETPWLSCAEDNEYLRRRVEELLRALPSDFSEVIVLKIWNGMTFQQIADTVGAPLPTITSRYRYAMRRMREELENNPIYE